MLLGSGGLYIKILEEERVTGIHLGQVGMHYGKEKVGWWDLLGMAGKKG